MGETSTESTAGEARASHVDVLIVGAGISGIGSAVHLTQQRPGATFVIIEKFDTFGGTWHLHTYPGIRSDSDLYTFGYRFKPWTGTPIATAAEIKKYMGEVIDEHGLADRIRYGHRVTSAAWSSAERRWTVEVTRLADGERLVFTCGFLYMCQGYYNTEEGYTPEWPGTRDFGGQIIHPMKWPEGLDLAGRRVVVIGSGATAATIVPAIAGECAHVTVLQRSPTYFIPGRNANDLADTLRTLEVDEEWVHEIVRRKILHDQKTVADLSFSDPDLVRDQLLDGVRALLPEGYDMGHFTPRYRPWHQRIAFVPDGDLFAGIREGRATMVTDEIETFNAAGILTKGGTQIDADVIITATGFVLSVLGDIPFTVDSEPVDWPSTVTYRGMMFTGVPNLAWIFGYFRASWTLRVDLMGDFICRLLAHMDSLGASTVVPRLRPADAGMRIGPFIDPENFNPNYLSRSIHLMPRSGDTHEWRHDQDYWSEKDILPAADLDDGCLVYS